MKIHVCVSPHNVLNSSNTRTNLASQRLLSSLLVLVLTLATIPSTISTPLFTLLDKKNNCDKDWDDINGGVSKKVDDVEACKDICADNINCVAITFWTKAKYCSVHSRLCDNPGSFATGRQVFRVNCEVTFWAEDEGNCAVSVGVVTNASIDTVNTLALAHVHLHLG